MGAPGRYGWVIVVAILLVQTVSSGFGFYNMSVYMTELAKVLNTPLAAVSFAVTLFFVTGGIGGIYVARLLDRVPVRWIMTLSALGCGACLALMGAADRLWQIYLLFALFGAANTGVSLVVGTTLITWWFPGRNRSIALSIASTGLSLGGIVITPVCAYLFNANGLAASMPWLGVAFAVLIIPIALLLVRAPEQPASSEPMQEGGNWGYQQAVRSRFFILLTLGYVMCMGAQVGGIAHLYNLVENVAGFATAATAVQVLTVCSISGRFAGGWLVTRMQPRVFTLINLVLQMLGLLLLSRAGSAAQALLGAAVLGLSVGNLLMMQPLWLADAFPGPVYPRVFALANALTVAGVALGPLLMGWVFDLSGYGSAYLGAVILSATAWAVVWAAGPTARRTST